jgi:hypothetical protein
VADLVAGYAHVRRGASAYAGVLRQGFNGPKRWTCSCRPVHLTASGAVACATAELERRRQGSREVFALRRCGPCDRWYPDGDGAACPACSVPMERVRVAVLERGPVS